MQGGAGEEAERPGGASRDAGGGASSARRTVAIFVIYGVLLGIGLLTRMAARHWHKTPDGSETIVSRGLTAPASDARLSPGEVSSASAAEQPPSLPLVEGSISGRVSLTRELFDQKIFLRVRTVLRLPQSGVGRPIGWETRDHTMAIEEDGTYSVKNLQLGDYSVQLILDDKAVSETLRVSLTRDRPSATGVDFGFQPVTGREVRGQIVIVGSSSPIPGAKVGLPGESGAETDALGQFRLGGLPDGPLQIYVTHPDYESRLVSAPEGDNPDLRVELTPLARVQVTVTDPGGRARRGVEVGLDARKFSEKKLTDGAGTAVFFALRPSAGAYTLAVAGARIVNPPAPFEVGPGERKTVAITVE